MSEYTLDPMIMAMIVESTKTVFNSHEKLVRDVKKYTISEREFIINMLPILGGQVVIKPEWVDGFMAYWSSKLEHNIHLPLYVVDDTGEVVLEIPPIFDHNAIKVDNPLDRKNINSRLSSLVKLQDLYSASKPQEETAIRTKTFNVSKDKLIDKEHSKLLFDKFKKDLDTYMRNKKLKIIDSDNTNAFVVNPSTNGFNNSDDFEDD